MKTPALILLSAPLLLIVALTLPRSAGAVSMPAGCENLSLAEYDTDADGLDDRYETCVAYTSHTLADTDADGTNDFQELIAGTSPRIAGKARLIDTDSDNDHLNDDWELKLGTGIMDPDSDGDLYLDGTEVAASYDPRDPSPAAKLEKLIHVKDKDLRLTYSMGGIELGTLPISTGRPRTPTPHGDFAVQSKIPVKAYIGPGYNYPDTKYNLWFTTKNGWRYYIHSAYWHNNFGVSPVSGGCVNVRIEDMEHLYWWAQHGTKVLID
jgi:hypothetical protein